MLIYIIRHGDAHHDSTTGRDRDRTLTTLGHEQARAVGVYLAGCRPMPGRVIGSPFVRAQETGRAACEVLGMTLETDDRLGADRGLSELVEVLGDHRDEEAVAVVSHMPTVGQAWSLLVNGVGAKEGSLRPGEVVVVRVDGDELVGGGVLIEVFRMGR